MKKCCYRHNLRSQKKLTYLWGSGFTSVSEASLLGHALKKAVSRITVLTETLRLQDSPDDLVCWYKYILSHLWGDVSFPTLAWGLGGGKEAGWVRPAQACLSLDVGRR